MINWKGKSLKKMLMMNFQLSRNFWNSLSSIIVATDYVARVGKKGKEMKR